MADLDRQAVLERLNAIGRDPQRAVAYMFDVTQDVMDGKVRFVNASNAHVMMTELMAGTAAANLQQFEGISRRVYPMMAKNEKDLYPHMTNRDYLNRFSSPAMTALRWLMPLQDVKGRAVPLNDGTGTRRLTIPKHTEVTIGDFIFTMQYPIDILVFLNGTVSVKMNVSVPSPIYSPITNDIQWSVQSDGVHDWLGITTPIQQLKLTSHIQQVTSFSGFTKEFSFTDRFHYIRAFINDPDTGIWTEASVTHNPTIYDSNIPTICVQVLNQSVAIYIPQIYYEKGLIRDAVRFDIYSCRGPVEVDLRSVENTSIKYRFIDRDYTDLSLYSAPFKSFGNLGVMAIAPVSGGTSELPFIELQRRVTQRSQYTADLPITPNQLVTKLEDRGFEVNINLDDITDRQVTAIRAPDAPKNIRTVSGLGCCVQLINLKVRDLMSQENILIGRQRTVIPPNTLFENVVGGVRIVPTTELNELKTIAYNNPDGIANIVNQREFYYSPYHYVLDSSNDLFEIRPYHMANPEVLQRTLIQQNGSLGLDWRSQTYGIGHNPDGSGYILTLELEPNESLKMIPIEKIIVQLSYLSADTGTRAHISGKLISPIDPAGGKPSNGRWLFRFDIKTDFDVNKRHHLNLTETGLPVDLAQDLDIVMIVQDYFTPDTIIGDIDTIVSINHIPNFDPNSKYVGVAQERISVRFGYYLKHLWRRSRPIVDEFEFKRYKADVIDTYSTDIFKVDKNGAPIIVIDHEAGTSHTVLLHRKGDVIYEKDGSPRILHKKGSLILNNRGEPTPIIVDDNVSREMDIFMVDGRYYFATDDETLEYRDTAVAQITQWITYDLLHLYSRVLERTELFYYPKATVGLIDVIVGNGTMVRMRANQSLRVTYTLTDENNRNPEIREMLRSSTAMNIHDAIQTLQRVTGNVITRHSIIEVLKRVYGPNIYDVEIEGLFDDKFSAIMVTDKSAVPAIGKKLVTLSNLTTQVQDDVSVDFVVLDNRNPKYNSKLKQRKS